MSPFSEANVHDDVITYTPNPLVQFPCSFPVTNVRVKSPTYYGHTTDKLRETGLMDFGL